MCAQCLLVQLPTLHTPGEIFSEYAYFSSYSSSWLEHAKGYAERVIEKFALGFSSQVTEIASNDGYLLQFFKEKEIPVLGIEPAKNVADVALAKGIPTIPRFFGRQLAAELEERADLLIGNNVLAHVPDLNDFVGGMKVMLKPRGVITMEFPHVLNLMEEHQFDTIYHEHFSYFSFHTVRTVFIHHSLEIFDVDLLSTHGGSLRIYAQHRETGRLPLSPNVAALLDVEKAKKLDLLATYLSFQQKAEQVKDELLSFLQQAHKEKKRVAAYGAPAKGNTLLNYCGLNAEFLPFTVDRSPYKQGKFLPGTHIPIFAPEKLFEYKPDYLLILPWNLKNEILSQTAAIRSWGGQYVIPIPHLEIF